MRYGHQGWRDLQVMDLKTFNRVYLALTALVDQEHERAAKLAGFRLK